MCVCVFMCVCVCVFVCVCVLCVSLPFFYSPCSPLHIAIHVHEGGDMNLYV